MNLEKAVNLFLSDLSNPNTRQSYYAALHPMSRYLGPARPVTDILPMHLVEYHQHLKSQDYAAATVFNRGKAIRHFFKWLVTIDVLPTNPALNAIKPKRPPRLIDVNKAMPEDEFERLLDYAKWHSRDYALILFIGDTGCRIGGAAGLRVNDIKLEDRSATVTEKGSKTRPVRFGFVAAAALDQWITEADKKQNDQVFAVRGKISSEHLGQQFRRCCIAAGITSRGPHSLRHRKGFQFSDARIDPSIAATALGHSDAVITLQHYYPKDWTRAAAALDELSTQPPIKDGKVIQIPRKTDAG